MWHYVRIGFVTPLTGSNEYAPCAAPVGPTPRIGRTSVRSSVGWFVLVEGKKRVGSDEIVGCAYIV
jgi:hypothetical protein